MSHKYYEQDHDMGNQSRMKYFDNWFKIYSKEIAKQREIPLSSYLSQIKDLSSFKAVLEEVFSLDGSLANYVSGMSDRSFELFFNRDVIQNIVKANQEKDEVFFHEMKKEIPIDVQQVEKQVTEFFKGTFKEKKTGKEKRVVAKKETVKVRGKDQVRFRDAKGHFVKKV